MDKKITGLLLVSIVVVGGLITVIMGALLKLDSKIIEKAKEVQVTATPIATVSPVTVATPTPEDGVVQTDWEVLVELIEACEAQSIMQTHSKEVRITTREGFVLKAIEPEIDDVFEIQTAVKDTCGNIPIATE